MTPLSTLMKPATCLLFLVFITPVLSSAKDWPGYRGPNGDGTTSESLAVKSFPASGPEAIWKAQTATGFSSFAVGGGRALTLITREVDGNPMEVCVALDAGNGREAWAAPLWIGENYGHGGGNSGAKGNDGGDGPRSTPVIDGNKVYVLDSHLRLYCLNLSDGEQVWAINLEKEYGAQNIKWMNANSPVIDGDRIFVGGGGRGQALLAFNKADGKLLWKGEDDAITHATPVVAEIHGVRQVIFFMQSGLVAASVEDGKVLWRQKFPFSVSTAASPVVFEDIVYCSAGYGVGGGAYRISKKGDGFESAEIWRTEKKNQNHWSTPVVKDGYLYGMFGFKEYGTGPLACVDIRTGEEKWAEPGFGPGGVLLTADGNLVALSDSGEIALVEAKPGGYSELARADVISGKCWSSPALAGGKVYVRSTVEGGCFDLGGTKVGSR